MLKQITFAILAALIIIPSSAHAEVDGTVSLKDTVEKAVKHHPAIKSLLFNREAQSHNLAAALGRFFPSLDLTGEFGLQRYNSSSARSADTENRERTASDTTLTLTQNIFDGLDRINDFQGSGARLESAEHRLQDNVEVIGLDAIRAHIDVVRERRLLALAEENVEAHLEVLDSIAERVAGGAGSLADEMQARGRVARAETTLIEYVGNLHIAEAAYARATGETPQCLADSQYMPELAPDSLEGLLAVSLVQNPRIKTFEADLLATTKDKNVTRSSMMPTVDIELSARYTDQLDGSETYLRDEKAMLAFSWNLFNGGQDYKDLQSASARVREAREELRDQVEETTQEAAVAWTEYQTALGQIVKHQEAVQYSMQTRDMYLMQFNVGQRSLLDVLDSINEVFSNSVLLETSNSNRDFGLYRILALEGELIKTLEVSDKAYEQFPEEPLS